MVRLQQVLEFLREQAPPNLAENWDNVGLLVGDADAEVASVLTCLTLTHNVADEAIATGRQLIVSHHPVLFRPVQRLTSESVEGSLLLKLIRAGIAVYSPHTSYDSAADGINAQLARSFCLKNVQPLRPCESSKVGNSDQSDSDGISGSGRWGELPQPMRLGDLLTESKRLMGVSHLQYVGEPNRMVARLAIACGSAAEFLRDAVRFGCEALLTGEARFHACLEAQSANIALILPGHYATERPAMETLAERLRSRFPQLIVHASHSEFDPVQFA